MSCRRALSHTFALLFFLAAPLAAQQAGMPPQNQPKPPVVQGPPAKGPAGASAPAPTAAGAVPAAPGKRVPPRPAAQAAPGGGPGMVWVNLYTSTYHCAGTRYYGKTANGRYMTESAARSAGAKGAGGKTCAAR